MEALTKLRAHLEATEWRLNTEAALQRGGVDVYQKGVMLIAVPPLPVAEDLTAAVTNAIQTIAVYEGRAPAQAVRDVLGA